MDAHDTLLISCGNAKSRNILCSIFEDNYNLLETDNTHQTLLLLEQNINYIAAILLDLTVQDKIDEDILSKIEMTALSAEIPIIMVVEDNSPDSAAHAFERNAMDIIFPHDEPHLIMYRVQKIIELCRNKWILKDRIEEQTSLLRHFNDTLVDALASIIEYRSTESGKHILRIRRFTQILLEEVAVSCPEYELTEETIKIISSASALHDVGKISIPDSILNKPGALTAEEWSVMKSHTTAGSKILETFHDIVNSDYFRYAHNICHYHHERWNGGGYPEGISGDDIPICAQVVGLVDAYDALVNKRVYKDAVSYNIAVHMILNGECGVFSNKLLECFKAVTGKFEETARAYADGLSPKTENFDVTLPSPAKFDAQNSLHRLQNKYQALLHIINCTAIEINLDKRIFHILYNPYPDLAKLGLSSSFEDIKKVLYKIVVPEDHHKLHSIFYEDFPRIMNGDTKKQVYHIRTLGASKSDINSYAVTIIVANTSDASNVLLVTCQRERTVIGMDESIYSSGDYLPKDAVYGLLSNIYKCRNDNFLTLEYGSPAFFTSIGYTAEELKKIHNNKLVNIILPEDYTTAHNGLLKQLEKGKTATQIFRIRHKDGNIVSVLNCSQLVTLEDGTEYFYGIQYDITSKTTENNEVQFTLEQYQNVLEQTDTAVFEWDAVTDTIAYSKQWYKLFGYNPISEKFSTELKKRSHFHPDDIPAFLDGIEKMKNGDTTSAIEARIAKSDGRYLWCRIRAGAIYDSKGKLLKVYGLLLNIDEEKRAVKTLKAQAERDSLTQLFNKQAGRKHVEEFLSSDPTPSGALILIDLDNFKRVNDQFGHMFGDTILSQAAIKIKRFFRSHDIVARIGGDEFMVLIKDLSEPNLIKQRCSQILERFSSTFAHLYKNCNLGCSIGIALIPEHGKSYQELFQRADQALYYAKGSGKNKFCFYSEDISVHFSLKKNITALNEHIDSNDEPVLTENNTIQHAFHQLYKTKDIESGINNVLKIVGQKMDVSRVYVFENNAENTHCSNTFEWCNEGIAPEINNLQNISYEEDIPGFKDLYNEHGILYCSDITELPKPVYDILQPQGIKSLLHCSIMDNGVFKGYIGFDDCSSNRLWTKEQINTLTFFSAMISVYILKHRAEENAAQQANDMLNILNAQNSWIYVIDPDTNELLFLNDKTRSLAEDVSVGMPCYKIKGLNERCADCPAINIKELKSNKKTLCNKRFNLNIEATATLIKWREKEACLISCNELKN